MFWTIFRYTWYDNIMMVITVTYDSRWSKLLDRLKAAFFQEAAWVYPGTLPYIYPAQTTLGHWDTLCNIYWYPTNSNASTLELFQRYVHNHTYTRCYNSPPSLKIANGFITNQTRLASTRTWQICSTTSLRHFSTQPTFSTAKLTYLTTTHSSTPSMPQATMKSPQWCPLTSQVRARNASTTSTSSQTLRPLPKNASTLRMITEPKSCSVKPKRN